jgi:hypothetical protein
VSRKTFDGTCCRRGHPGRVFAHCALLMGLLWLASGPVAADSSVAPGPELEKAILAENWEKVIRLLPTEAEPNLPAVSRLIKGHACLALNRNNESLRLFARRTSKDDLAKWDEWTTDLRNRHPDNPISGYLRGDALARLQRPSEAVEVFTAYLKASPQHILLLNARGVAYCGMGRFEKALEDITQATTVAPSFVDADLSLGSLWIQWGTGPEGALEAFNAALAKSPNSIVAMNGRACAQLALGHLEESFRDLQDATRGEPWFSLPVVNMVSLGLMRDQLMVRVGEGHSQVKPGTAIKTVISTIELLDERQARANYVKAETNRQRSSFLQGVGAFLSREGDITFDYLFPWPWGDPLIPKPTPKPTPTPTPEPTPTPTPTPTPPDEGGKDGEKEGEKEGEEEGSDEKKGNSFVRASDDQPVYHIPQDDGSVLVIGEDGNVITVIPAPGQDGGKDGGENGGDDGGEGGKGDQEGGKTPTPALLPAQRPQPPKPWPPQPGPRPVPPGPGRPKPGPEGGGTPGRDFPWPEEGPVWGPAPGGGVSPPDTPPLGFPYPPGVDPPYEWPPKAFGERLARESIEAAAFWETYKSTLARLRPEVVRRTPTNRMPGGITGEGLLRAYTDQGNWLTTQFGLVYPMTKARAASTEKENER